MNRIRSVYHEYKEMIISLSHGLILGCAGIYMLHMSWRKWLHVLHDNGRELYVPWQLSQGSLLYRDMHHLYGPLSDYVHALMFKLFGVSMMTLAYFNIVLIIVLTWIIYDFFRNTTDRITALVVSLSFIVLFPFAAYGATGLYNYVFPYAYESTHGAFLSILSLWLFFKYLQTKRTTIIKLIAFISGLVFLTKWEPFFADIVSVILMIIIVAASEEEKGARGRLIISSALYFSIAPLIFLIYYAVRTTPIEAINALLYPYNILHSAAEILSFRYMRELGLEKLSWCSIGNALAKALKPMLYYCLIYFVLKYIDIRYGRHIQAIKRTWIRFGIYVYIACVFYYLTDKFFLYEFYDFWTWKAKVFLMPVPYLLILFVAYAVFREFLTAKGTLEYNKLLALIVFAVFSLVLSERILFRTNIYSNGFILAMPSALCIFALSLYWIPRFILKIENMVLFRFAMTGVMLAMLLVHIQLSRDSYKLNTEPFGRGNDMIYVNPTFMNEFGNDSVMKETLTYIDSAMTKEDTFVILPQGVLLNYLLRRKTIPYYSDNPLESSLYDENNVIGAIDALKPAYILIDNENRWNDGFTYFGYDYGRKTYQWIMNHYEIVHTIGEPSYEKQIFGVFIYKRKVL